MAMCKKVCYPSRRAAVVALRAIAKKNERRGLSAPRGAYLCVSCKRWHLTSAPGIQVPPWSKSRTHA